MANRSNLGKLDGMRKPPGKSLPFLVGLLSLIHPVGLVWIALRAFGVELLKPIHIPVKQCSSRCPVEIEEFLVSHFPSLDWPSRLRPQGSCPKVQCPGTQEVRRMILRSCGKAPTSQQDALDSRGTYPEHMVEDAQKFWRWDCSRGVE